jgi:hypothetical protein
MKSEHPHLNPNLAYAVKIVHATCCLAGSASYLADLRVDLRECGIIRAVKNHDTPALFDWLIEILSFQGISDAIAAGYMAQHGSARWADIAEALSRSPSCSKLGGYWRFYDCRYHKGSNKCSELSHIDGCPLPRHPLRNGHLNQMAYSLFLFMRDVADNDFVGWIDSQLGAVDPQSPDRLMALREAIIGPLRNIYGVADKVLGMALSSLCSARGSNGRCGSKSARLSWRSTPWSIISCTELGSYSVFAPSIRTETGAIGREGAPAFSGCWRRISMLASSIQPSRQRFHGSCRARSGGTAPRTASTFATAIASTTTRVATTGIANCFAAVIA